MKFFYLEDTQITEACALRWCEAGLIELVEVCHDRNGTEYHYISVPQ